MSESIAHFNGISHLYDQHRALDDVEFTLPRTGIIGLLGLNGAGKTTTMNLLCGVLTPTLGQVLIDGHSMKLEPKRCKQLIGYAPDRPPLYPDCTVKEFLNYAGALRKIERKKRPEATAAAMESTGIADHSRKLCGHLSHGYRQRLNLAQAILHRPPLIVLDEPTSGLDPAQIESVRALIRDLSQSACVLISTHLLFEAQQLCGRVLIVHRGKIIEDTVEGEGGSEAPRLILRFSTQSADVFESLLSCPAVADVQPEEDGVASVRLAGADERQARSQLLGYIVDSGIDLLEMREDSDTLEKRFLELTRAPDPTLEDSVGESADSADGGDDSAADAGAQFSKDEEDPSDEAMATDKESDGNDELYEGDADESLESGDSESPSEPADGKAADDEPEVAASAEASAAEESTSAATPDGEAAADAGENDEETGDARGGDK